MCDLVEIDIDKKILSRLCFDLPWKLNLIRQVLECVVCWLYYYETGTVRKFYGKCKCGKLMDPELRSYKNFKGFTHQESLVLPFLVSVIL